MELIDAVQPEFKWILFFQSQMNVTSFFKAKWIVNSFPSCLSYTNVYTVSCIQYNIILKVIYPEQCLHSMFKII